MSDPNPYAVLDAPGWDISKVDGDPTDGKIRYALGDWTLRVNWRSEQLYDSYLTSRRRISESTTVALFGKPAESWAYNPRDHTVIRPVEGETFFEVRGEGMHRTAFVDLLARLHQVDADDFAERLPASVARPQEVDATVTALLTGVETPGGFDVSTIRVPPYQEPYHVAAHVTGRVGCAWIDLYAAACSAGDSVSRQRAVDAMAGSRTWPVLREIQHAGGWAEEYWRVADDMAAGEAAGEMYGRIDLTGSR